MYSYSSAQVCAWLGIADSQKTRPPAPHSCLPRRVRWVQAIGAHIAARPRPAGSGSVQQHAGDAQAGAGAAGGKARAAAGAMKNMRNMKHFGKRVAAAAAVAAPTWGARV